MATMKNVSEKRKYIRKKKTPGPKVSRLPKMVFDPNYLVQMITKGVLVKANSARIVVALMETLPERSRNLMISLGLKKMNEKSRNRLVGKYCRKKKVKEISAENKRYIQLGKKAEKLLR